MVVINIQRGASFFIQVFFSDINTEDRHYISYQRSTLSEGNSEALLVTGTKGGSAELHWGLFIEN